MQSVTWWAASFIRCNEEDQVQTTIKRMVTASKVTMTPSLWAYPNPKETRACGRCTNPITIDKLMTSCCNKTNYCSRSSRNFDRKNFCKLPVFGQTKSKFRGNFMEAKEWMVLFRSILRKKVGFSRRLKQHPQKMLSGQSHPLPKAKKIWPNISAALFFHFTRQTHIKLPKVSLLNAHQYQFKSHSHFHSEMERILTTTRGN